MQNSNNAQISLISEDSQIILANKNAINHSRDNEFSKEFWNEVKTQNVYQNYKPQNRQGPGLWNYVSGGFVILSLMFAVGLGFSSYANGEFSNAFADSMPVITENSKVEIVASSSSSLNTAISSAIDNSRPRPPVNTITMR
jgi:hypothetical protein